MLGLLSSELLLEDCQPPGEFPTANTFVVSVP